MNFDSRPDALGGGVAGSNPDWYRAASAARYAPDLPRLLRLALLCALLLLAAAAAAQISPGPLSQAHRQLGGATGCTQCHAVSPGERRFRCLDCHTEIASRLQQKRGLHPTFMDASAGSAGCVRCHSEHNGENFAIVKWNPATVEHAKTGFPLDGKHAALACGRCHNVQLMTASERETIKARDLNHSFLGLSPTCLGCHEDVHHGQLGTNCTQCHNTADWHSARGFDHSRTRFALTGAHAQVGCGKCHAPAAGRPAQFKGLQFASCASCHRDPHRGSFAQECASCHTTRGWRQTAFASQFDHAKTGFALAGKHLQVACATCHRGGDFKTAIAHATCASCHKPDPHNGQFLQRADKGACESCHTVDGFRPAKFSVADHAATGFPLRAKHASVTCQQCHKPAGRATLFRVKFAECTACHQDAHGSQFAALPYRNRCQECHTEVGFRPSTFTLARHQKGRFVLTGGHVAVACIDCHRPPAAGSTTIATYRFGNPACTACHADPHQDQFGVRMAKLNAQGQPMGCQACHSTQSWRDLASFDHAATAFPLAGAHRAVDCAGCHRSPRLEPALARATFRGTPAQCAACHTDPHAGQFQRAGVTPLCSECHTAARWRPSLFDHEKTAFSLKGAHQNTRCAACHVNIQKISDHDVLVYKPTPTKCASCHGERAAARRPLELIAGEETRPFDPGRGLVGPSTPM